MSEYARWWEGTEEERTWPRPRSVRHAWVRFRNRYPDEPPDAATVVTINSAHHPMSRPNPTMAGLAGSDGTGELVDERDQLRERHLAAVGRHRVDPVGRFEVADKAGRDRGGAALPGACGRLLHLDVRCH